MRLFFGRAARLEYDEAANWYESQRHGLGVEFVHEIERALLKVSDMPHRFPLVLADVRRVGVQRFPYSIFFRVRGERLIVLAVFHVRRDPAVWQERASGRS